MPKPSDLPNLYYDTLRAIHESRAKRHDQEANIPHLTNSVIFSLLDDRHALIWAEAAQPTIRDNVLARMWNTVEWSAES